MGVERRPIRILIVEDHAMFAEAVANSLGALEDMEVLGTADSLAAARTVLARTSVDVIVLDQRLPDGRGTVAAPELSILAKGARVLIVSADADDAVVSATIHGACAGYVNKAESMGNLIAAVRAAHAGSHALSPLVLARMAELHSGERSSALTPRELTVLTLLVDGLSNERIAERLFVSVNTVRNHLQSIFDKLNVHSRVEAVTKAIHDGMVAAP